MAGVAGVTVTMMRGDASIIGVTIAMRPGDVGVGGRANLLARLRCMQMLVDAGDEFFEEKPGTSSTRMWNARPNVRQVRLAA